MKIVGVDNFDTELVSDTLVAANIKNKEFADLIAKTLNDKYCNYNNAPTHYVVKEDDYKLYVYDPNG